VSGPETSEPSFVEQDGPANPARVYDYWLGGKDHYAVDRRAGDQVAALAPWVVSEARANRRFIHRVVRYLVHQGITQFIDAGSGLPTARNVHEIAQELNPVARVVYVDHDPVVLTHARALLATDTRTVVVEADARDPERLMTDPGLTGHLDLREPVGVLFAAVLHFVSDAENPAGIVAAVRDRLAPGSHVVISHATPGDEPTASSAAWKAADVYAERAGAFTLRDRPAVERLFDGFDLVEPGLVPVRDWHPHGSFRSQRGPVSAVGAVGRRP
jgi:S-adenosyl methyltransferase